MTTGVRSFLLHDGIDRQSALQASGFPLNKIMSVYITRMEHRESSNAYSSLETRNVRHAKTNIRNSFKISVKQRGISFYISSNVFSENISGMVVLNFFLKAMHLDFVKYKYNDMFPTVPHNFELLKRYLYSKDGVQVR